MKAFILIFAFFIALQLSAQKVHQLIVDTDETIAEVSPTMWGLFFEDINFAADGGIYAELVKNRSFEFKNPLQGWKMVGLSTAKGEALIINRTDPSAKNPRFMRLTINKYDKAYGMQNEGFRGMGVREGEIYNFYIQTKTQSKNLKLKVELIDEDGNIIGSNTINSFENKWKEYSCSFKSSKTVEKAQLRVLFEGNGLIDIDMISLFPENTWKNREKGLRADLIQLLDDLKPGFLRFPGGCIVEGYTLEERYQWKNTVGSIDERVLIKNRWLDEFNHRLTPDYYQSFGIGFYEYFLLSEDLNAEPLPILNCGMACQYNSGEVCSMNELESYIQDAIDLIEFANGDTSTKWGKLRANMGHPEPFNLTYLGIGNEQWGPQYVERYAEFHKVLKEKHPEIVIISAAGPTPDERNKYLWEELTKLNADIIDEHYYKSPEWFLSNANRYDSFDRNGPKVFAGEYASHTKGKDAPESRNNWLAALTEAAFMTGLERNADIVTMTAYAPLFANKNAWQWNPDLIWFDNMNAMPTPNYFVQQTFSLNKGNRVLPITENQKQLIGQDSLYSSVTINDDTNTLMIKLVNVSHNVKTIDLNIKGSKHKKNNQLLLETYNGNDMLFNEVGEKNNFNKQVSNISYKTKLPNFEITPRSLNVVKIQID